MIPNYPSSSEGMYRQVMRLHRRHPLLFPGLLLTVAILGLVFTSPFIAGSDFAAVPFAVFVLLTLVAAAVLRSGITTWREKRVPVVLVCPRCEARSATSSMPFKVTKFYDVDYAAVVCPLCGNDFTAPGDRPLV